MTTREQLHAIVDELPEELLPSAGQSLARIQQSRDEAFWEALENAPIDDEPLTAEDVAAIDAATRRLDAGLRVNDAEANRLLRRSRDAAFWEMLENAPIDDEPVTEEDRAAIDRARARSAAGEKGFTTEQVDWILERLGLAGV